MKHLTIAILILFVIGAGACKSAIDYHPVTEAEGMDRSISRFTKGSRPVRIGVMDFTDHAGNIGALSRMVTDEVVFLLSDKKQLRLLERDRLYSILKEHSLEQSGLVSGKDAQRFGEILPVDVIVAGSYIREEKGIRVNGRFVDVKTGEIPGTFHFYILEDRGPEAPEKGEEEDEECDADPESIKNAFSDLRTEQMQSRAVDAITSVPYSVACSPIHDYAITVFTRGKLYPQRYIDYLGSEMARMNNIYEYRRKGRILYYYASDGDINNREWELGIKGLEKANTRAARILIARLLNLRRQERNSALDRIDRLFEIVKEGRIGKPYPMSDNLMFFAVHGATGSYSDKWANEYRLYLFESYLNKIEKNDNGISRALGKVTDDMEFNKVKDFNDRYMRVARAIIRPVDRLSGWNRTEDEIWSVLYMANRKVYSGLLSKGEFADFVTASNDFICESVQMSSGYKGKKHAEFAVKNGFKCDTTPDVNGLIKILSSYEESAERREEAAQLLLGMGTDAKLAEAIAREYLGARGEDSQNYKIRKYCIAILGAIKTEDLRSIDSLIDMLGNRQHGGNARVALGELKESIVIARLRVRLLSVNNRNTQYAIMDILSSRGKRARSALPEIRKIQKTTTDRWIRDGAARAIKRIETDL